MRFQKREKSLIKLKIKVPRKKMDLNHSFRRNILTAYMYYHYKKLGQCPKGTRNYRTSNSLRDELFEKTGYFFDEVDIGDS